MKKLKDFFGFIFLSIALFTKVTLIILIIASFFIKMDTTEAKKAELLEPGILDYISLSKVDQRNKFEMVKVMYDYKMDKYKVTEDLGVFSGIKNGILVVIGFFRDTIVGFALDYIAGFYDKGLIGKAIWLVLGLFLSAILNLLGAFLGMFALAFGLLIQPASMGYYVAYIISFVIMLLGVFAPIEDL